MRLAPALVLTLVALPLAADTTGRLSGKITGKDGKPVANAKVVLKRVDVNWIKELKVSANGSYMQVGLEPKEFELEVTAEGFAPFKDKLKVPLGDVITRNITLLTPSEAAKEAGGGKMVVVEDPGAQLENTGSDAFNEAVGLYNEKKYSEALPLVDLAYKNLKESLEKTKDEKAKADLVSKIEKVERTYALTAFEVGMANEGKRALLDEIKPILDHVLDKNPKDTRVLDALLKIAKERKDKAGETKYQAMVSAIIGPQPELPYNEAVAAFNAGNLKAAKEGVLQAIQIDPKFADSYWLMGVLEFSSNNLAGAKTNLRKYLELAPTGKKAAEVKEMLRELK